MNSVKEALHYTSACVPPGGGEGNQYFTKLEGYAPMEKTLLYFYVLSNACKNENGKLTNFCHGFCMRS